MVGEDNGFIIAFVMTFEMLGHPPGAGNVPDEDKFVFVFSDGLATNRTVYCLHKCRNQIMMLTVYFLLPSLLPRRGRGLAEPTVLLHQKHGQDHLSRYPQEPSTLP